MDRYRRIEAIEQRKRELLDKLHDALDRAEREKRELHPDESRRFSAYEHEIRDLSEQASKLRDEEREARPARQIAPEGGVTQLDDNGRRPSISNGRVRRDTLALRPEQRFSDWIAARHDGGDRPFRTFANEADLTPEDAERYSIGRAIRAMATGDWEGAELERRALATSVNASGGFLTPEPLTGPFIDLVRNKTRVLQAGATTIPLDSDQHSIPRLVTGGTAAWRNENTPVFESEGTFDRITFTPRTLARTTLLSFELAEDMLPGAAQRIDDEIAGSLALELDRVALRGSGTAPEPRGVRNHAGVEIRADLGANGAVPTNYDFLVRILAGVRRDNFEPNAIIYSTRTEETLALLKTGITGDQTPLQRPPMLAAVPELVSNQIPDSLTLGTSTDTSEAYAGQWDELLIGVRPSIGVRFVREQKADTLQYRITAYLRADVQVAHGQAFAVSTGIRA